MSEYDPGVKARIGERLAEIHAANEYRQMLDEFNKIIAELSTSSSARTTYTLNWALSELSKKVK